MAQSKYDIIIDASQSKSGSREVKQSFDTIANSAKRTTRELHDTGSELENVAHKAGSVKNAILGLAGVTGAGLGVASIRESIIGFQELHYALDASTASAIESERAFEVVSNTSNKLGLSLKTTGMQFAQLTGATYGTELAGRRTEKMFIGISEASTALHLSTQRTSTVLDAFSKALSGGKVQGEDLNRIIDSIPTSLNLLSEATGKSASELRQLMAQGKLTSEYLEILGDAFHKTYGKQAEEASNSLLATTHKLENSFDSLKNKIGQNGLSDSLIRLNVTLKTLIDDSDGLAESLGEALSGAVNLTSNAIIFLNENIDSLSKAGKIWLGIFTVNKISAITASFIALTAQTYKDVAATIADTAAKKELALAEAQTIVVKDGVIKATFTEAAATAKFTQSTVAANEAMLASGPAANVAASGFARAGSAANIAASANSRFAASVGLAGTAMKGFGKAMSLLGGPAGLLVLSAYLLYEYTNKQRDNTDAVREAKTYLDELNKSRKEFNDLTQKSDIYSREKDLNDAYAKMSMQLDDIQKKRKEIKELRALNDIVDISSDPSNIARNYSGNRKQYINEINALNTEESSIRKAMEENRVGLSELEKQLKNIDDQIIVNKKQSNAQQKNILAEQKNLLEQELDQIEARIGAYKIGSDELLKIQESQERAKEAQKISQASGLEDTSGLEETLKRIQERKRAEKELADLDTKRRSMIHDLVSADQKRAMSLAEVNKMTKDLAWSTQGLTSAEFKRLADAQIELDYLRKQKDGLSGLKRAWLDYQESMTDIATSVEGIFNASFNAIEDNIIDVCESSKSAMEGLRDIARLVLHELLKLAVQQAILRPLMGALGMPMGAYGGMAASMTPQGLQSPGMFATNTSQMIAPAQQPKPVAQPLMQERQDNTFQINTNINVESRGGSETINEDVMKEVGKNVRGVITDEIYRVLNRESRSGGRFS